MNRLWIAILSLAMLLAGWDALPAADNSVAIQRMDPAADAAAIGNVRPVKNVIVMIGDGMGYEAVTAARIASFGRGLGLTMDRLPAIGQSITLSLSDDLITDSGAGATAIACGQKTTNGRIGTDQEGRPLRTILELARGLGKATGIVATCDITHATPASFAAHVKDRNNAWEIARQLAATPADVMLGGGSAWFLPGSRPGSKRDDELDLLAELRKKGMTVITDPAQFKALDPAGTKKLAALLASGHLKPAAERQEGPSLEELTRTALAILARDSDGFFLMVEGSQIDWAGHGKDIQNSVAEVLEFDRAIAAALEFATKDGQTLLVVTADHETGGLSLTAASERGKTLAATWATGDHTANIVPLWAFGPNQQAFARVIQNHQIPQLAIQGWGVKNFTGFAHEK